MYNKEGAQSNGMRVSRLVQVLSLLLATGGLAIGTAVPTKADLGDADITGPTGGTTTGNTFDGWCGEKRTDCKVTFSNERLVVDAGQGITKQQYRSVKKNHVCRYRSLGILDCSSWDGSAKFYDKEFLISYTASDGGERTALITFRNQQVSDKFERDLEIWSQKVLRPIGPSIEISK
jgi:hypothetical protein